MAAPPPPDDTAPPGGSRDGVLDPAAPDQVKARLDDTELSAGSPRAQQKVELDLDDAPFLEDEPEEAAPLPEIPTAPPPQELDEPLKLPFWKKKLVLIGGAALLLVTGAAVWWFLLRTPPEPPPPPPPPPAEEPAPPAPPPPPPQPPDVFVELAPFVVEKVDAKGVSRVVNIKLKLVYKQDSPIVPELQLKAFPIRDGLYYNLKNKTFNNLTDKDEVEKIREELRGVVNNYLNSGQIDQVLFDELLVK
ncbi:flagellar basal body-associated FliL family protein [Fundidesulfovibrio soli]|uniref:flagellar basal body-associated FliL family protein n=1 Tax=Fundidesulfovibrio soli TaxID=2922716 RepID=UPI001FAF2F43|nr:flagellar basal body-associated FliL family protein [Fundidesulfovibrio soli]